MQGVSVPNKFFSLVENPGKLGETFRKPGKVGGEKLGQIVCGLFALPPFAMVIGRVADSLLC